MRFGHAAEQEPLGAGHSLAAHDDQLRTDPLCHVDDGLGGSGVDRFGETFFTPLDSASFLRRSRIRSTSS